MSERLVNSVDFAPTILQLAGVAAPDYLQGTSFFGKGNGREFVFGARDRMDERYDIIRAVRSDRFRYVRNFEPPKPYYQYMNTPEQGATMQEIRKAEKSGILRGDAALFSATRKPTEELYDLETDPHEMRNLAEDPAHARALADLRQALTDWQMEIGDIGLIPESEILRREKEAGSAFAILHGEKNQSAFIESLTTMATKASSGAAHLPDLRGAMDHADAAVRYWGATGIGNFAEESKVVPGLSESLEARLSDESPAVAIAAARALCRMGEPEKGLATLEKHLGGDNEWARLEAVIVLDELDEAARPSLAAIQGALLEQPNKYIVRVANKAVNDLLGTNHRTP